MPIFEHKSVRLDLRILLFFCNTFAAALDWPVAGGLCCILGNRYALIHVAVRTACNVIYFLLALQVVVVVFSARDRLASFSAVHAVWHRRYRTCAQANAHAHRSSGERPSLLWACVSLTAS